MSCVFTTVLLLGLGIGHVTATSGYRLLDDSPDLNTEINKSEVYMDTRALVTRHGYPVESHVVTTDDGYILTVHRIPHGKNDINTGVRPPLILFHGLFVASDCWVLTGPGNAPGFILADSGYDVWMINARGTFYSLNHTTMSSKDPKYWNFSWHEMGNHDLPAVIDYILETTAQEKLFYVGHSMGTTVFFVLMSTQPQYNEKIRLMVALAPAVYFAPVRSPISLLVPYAKNIVDAYLNSGQGIILPRTRSFVKLVDDVCTDPNVGGSLCRFFYRLSFGNNQKEFNSTLLPSVIAHLTGAAVHSANHFVENMKSNKFQWYDTKRRGRTMQLYDLSKVTCPVSLHYALADTLVHPNGVLRLSKELPNVVALTQLADDEAGHAEFILALHTKKLVYDDVIKIMDKY